MKILILFLICLLAVSCSSGSKKDSTAQPDENIADNNNQDDDSPVSDVDSPVLDKKLGGFAVRIVAPVAATAESEAKDGYTSVSGKIYSGEYPDTVVWEESEKSGSCTLFIPRVPFCETPCGGSAACVEDNICMDYPETLSAGNVTIKGVKTSDGTSEFIIKPVKNNYTSAVSIPFNSFVEGAEITLEAAGGDVKSFSIKTTGISSLEITNETLPIQEGNSLVVNWKKPGKENISKIHAELNISHHGGSRGKIECDSEDNGSLEISADLIKKLLTLGVSGFPTIILNRYFENSYKSEFGIITFSTISEAQKAVEIPGLISCKSDDECPENQTCQDDQRCGQG